MRIENSSDIIHHFGGNAIFRQQKERFWREIQVEKIWTFKIVRELVPVPLYIATVILQAHLPVQDKDGKVIFKGLGPPVNYTRQQKPKRNQKENPDNTT